MAVLHFEDGQERRDDRLHQALCAMVAAGKADPRKAWPEYFASADQDLAFPSKDADMSGFSWEAPTPESVAADIESMMRGARVTVLDRDTAAPPAAPPVAMPPPPREDQAGLRPAGRRTRPPAGGPGSLEWG